MDYLNALITKIRSCVWYSIISVACIFGSCTSRGAISDNANFTTAKCLELVYQGPNSFSYTLSLNDSVLSYTYDNPDLYFTVYSCRIRPLEVSATDRDITAFLNDTIFSQCKMQVRENGKRVRGSKAQKISEYLVGVLLLNSPIIIYHDNTGFPLTKDNSLYHYYNEEPDWHTIEITVEDAEFLDKLCFLYEKIIVGEDSLSYVYEDERVSKILKPEEKAEISNLLRRIDLNSAFESYLEVTDSCGIQIKVDGKIIFTDYPWGVANGIADGIYSDLMTYIMQLSPVQFTSEDFVY